MSNGWFVRGMLIVALAMATALAIVLAAGTAMLASPPAAAAPSPVKKCLPQKLDGGGTIDLATYKGKVVYLDYWASWCGPCRLSFPFMNTLQKEFSNDVVVIGISVDTDKKDTEPFLKETSASFLLGIDTSGVCPQEFGVNGMPSTYIFDRKGDLAYSHEGFRKTDPEKLRAKLKEIVDRK